MHQFILILSFLAATLEPMYQIFLNSFLASDSLGPNFIFCFLHAQLTSAWIL